MERTMGEKDCIRSEMARQMRTIINHQSQLQSLDYFLKKCMVMLFICLS